MDMLPPILASQSAQELLRTLMIALGVLAIALGLRTRFRSRPELKWPAAAGRVVRSHLESTSGAQTRLSVAFRYKVLKRSIESRPLSVAIPTLPADANRTLKRFSNGRRVTVYYDPSNPESVQVDTTPPGNWAEAVVAGGALVLFALYAF